VPQYLIASDANDLASNNVRVLRRASLYREALRTLSSLCPSVRPSVTLVICVKAAQRIADFFHRLVAKHSSFFKVTHRSKIAPGSPSTLALNAVGIKPRFDHCLTVSETI